MGKTRKRRRTIKFRRGGMKSMSYRSNHLASSYQENTMKSLRHSPTSKYSLTSNSPYLYGDKTPPSYMSLKPDNISSSIIKSSESKLIQIINRSNIKGKILNIIESNNDKLISVFKEVAKTTHANTTTSSIKLSLESQEIIQNVSFGYTQDKYEILRALGRVFIILLFIVISSCIATNAFGNQLIENPIEAFEIFEHGIRNAMLAIIVYGGHAWIEIYNKIGRRRNGWFRKALITARALLLH